MPLQNILDRATNILGKENPQQLELDNILNEISSELDIIARENIIVDMDLLTMAEDIKMELQNRLDQNYTPDFGIPNAYTPPAGTSSTTVQPPIAVVQSKPVVDHNPDVERLMNEAEEAFYSGDYKKAIEKYERVLALEPGWSRAQDHKQEAEESLRTGKIPLVALPPEAARVFGKATSAARVGRYKVALQLLDEATKVLEARGIRRWEDGDRLRTELETQQQAQEVYEEGLGLLRQGDLEQAITKFQIAANAAPSPEYTAKQQQVREIINKLQIITDTVNNANQASPESMASAKRDLEAIANEIGEIPRVVRLRGLLTGMIPTAIKSLKESAKQFKNNAEFAQTIEMARSRAEEAKTQVVAAAQFGILDDGLTRLSNEIDQILAEIQTYENELDQSRRALLNGSRLFPLEARRISANIRRRFPTDPKVLELKRGFSLFNILVTVAILIGIAIVGLVAYTQINKAITASQIKQTQIAQVTFQAQTVVAETAYAAANPTQTPTLTQTPTMTPTSTLTPTITPTPRIQGFASRDVWIRFGCYETFEAITRISEGSQVLFLYEGERKFDSFNRECALVKYVEPTSGKAYTGYLLYEDIGASQ